MVKARDGEGSNVSVPASVEGTEANKAAKDFENKPIPPVVGAPLSAAATAREPDINPDTGLSKKDEAEKRAKGEPLPDPDFKPNQYELNQAIPDPKDAERARAAMGKQPEKRKLSSDERLARIEKYLIAQGAPLDPPDEPQQQTQGIDAQRQQGTQPQSGTQQPHSSIDPDRGIITSPGGSSIKK